MHLRIFLLQESSIKVPTIFSHIELCFQSKPLRTILSRDKLRKHSQPQDRSIKCTVNQSHSKHHSWG